MSLHHTTALQALESACEAALGPQNLFLNDPCSDATRTLYSQRGDLTKRDIEQIICYTSSFYERRALQRILPEILEGWEDLLQAPIWEDPGTFGRRTQIGFAERYELLATAQLIREDCDQQIAVSATTAILEPIISKMQTDSTCLDLAFTTMDSRNAFLSHFNTCACVLPSIEPLWNAWWSLRTPTAVLNASWFIYGLSGDFLDDRISIVDTRDLSHAVISPSSIVPFWSDESRRMLLHQVDWEILLSRLKSHLMSYGAGQFPNSWSMLDKILNEQVNLVGHLSRRFTIYVERMCRGKTDWRAWQEVENT